MDWTSEEVKEAKETARFVSGRAKAPEYERMDWGPSDDRGRLELRNKVRVPNTGDVQTGQLGI